MKIFSHSLRRGLTMSLLVVFAFLFGVPAGPALAQRSPLASRVPAPPAGAVDNGPVAAAAKVQATLYLTPSAVRVAALDELLAAQLQPSSARYHQWLTPAQFGMHFGAEAAQVAAVQTFAQNQGLRISEVFVSGLRLTLSGTATQIEAAFAPGLHSFVLGGKLLMSNTAVPVVPADLGATVAAIGGFDTVSPATTRLNIDSSATLNSDLLSAFGEAVTANSGRVLALTTTTCAESLAPSDATAFSLLAREAAAQGMSVLAAAACADGGTVSYAGTLGSATSVTLVPGLSQSVSSNLLGTRPEWQHALGLPADSLRQVPDLTVSSLAALSQTVESILASLPAAADGSPARIGNLSVTLYSLAGEHGLFSQPDSPADGTWEPRTGLGLVDLGKLGTFYPRGTLSDNVSITSSNYAPTHGQTITLTSSVTDTSGQANGAVPSGTVTFTTSAGLTLGSNTLANGSTSITLNSLPGGTYSITANYSGDGVFVANTSVVANLSVQGEAAALSASVASSVALGGTIQINVKAVSQSGVGTPTGTVSAQPQGISNTGTYTATLAGSNGTATATISVPATQAGNIVILVSCTPSDPSFTCYSPASVTATVTQGASTTTLVVSPNPPVTGQTTTFTASVTGAAAPAVAPTGNVTFYDNGVTLGSGTLVNGTATYTTQSLSGTIAHTFTASYVGDNNYKGSSANGVTTPGTPVATTTTLTINPTAPVAGSQTTLTANIAYPSGGATPSGLVTFYEDGAPIGAITVTSGTVTLTTTAISGTVAHTFYATYSGDANYAPSTSAPITSTGGASTTPTTTTLSISPTSPVKGMATTLTASVAFTYQGTAATGTVQFYQDGVLIGNGALNTYGLATLTSTAIDGTTAHTFYAVYLGDTIYATSRSATISTKAGSAMGPTTTTITAAGLNLNAGVATQFTATVAGNPVVNGTAPTGTVSFYSSTQGLIGSAPLTNGTAVLSVALTTTGYQTISAVYNGDATYQSSTSTTNPTVTVTATQAPQTVIITPMPITAIPFGAPVTVTVNITGLIVVGNGNLPPGTLPTGTENFLITPLPQGTTNLAGTNVPLTATSTTTATATYTFTPPAVGSYVVAAQCTGTNFQCSITPITQVITVVKGATTITVTANPLLPVAGQATTLTATIMPVAPSTNTTNTYGGTVTFYDNGVSLGTGTLVGNVAMFSTTLNSTVNNVITAIYSGDTNFTGSTSTGITLTNPPVVTTGTLTSNLGTALQQSNIIFTASISTTPTATNPSPGPPYGNVTFYDLYKGQVVTLGTASLVPTGPYLSVAQLSTTGLFAGVHSVTAVFGTSTNYAGVTTSAVSVTITDYSLTFNPPTLVLRQGQTGTATVTVAALSGFTGTVVLGCTPPSGAGTTCSFNPAQISTSGTSTLTISTTIPHAQTTHAAGLGATGLGLAVAAALCWLLLPRRRRPALLALLVLCGLVGTSGCTVLNNSGETIITNGTSGTPLGTLQYTITTSGSDGVTTNRHDLQYQVTIQ